MDIHDTECAFYNAVAGIEDFPLPKVWLAQPSGKDQHGVILMEDLSAVGYKTGWTETLNAAQVCSPPATTCADAGHLAAERSASFCGAARLPPLR